MRFKHFAVSGLFVLISPVFGQFSISSDFRGDTLTMTYSRPTLRWMRPVTGAPYSGEHVFEHVQTLADGTRVTQTPASDRQWRDSEGRTRLERAAIPGPTPPWSFTIPEVHDPVAGFLYVIDDQNKVVHRFKLSPALESSGPAPTRIFPLSPQIAPPPTRSTAEKPGQPEVVQESLGSQNIEGVIAEGHRITRVIPVGSMGNDRPMTTVSEMWTSRELLLTVLSKTSDPRNGENSSRLTKISRVEPDPALFQPPAGYEIVDEKESFTMTLKKP
jgi:hypothetical protein